ncbi:hypothetical protein [Klebsiella aerogenes]|uniref:hypothetical protein n=1 Tax=Klebsiella aerogenes TaxID=548 RepID=UPI0032D9C40F
MPQDKVLGDDELKELSSTAAHWLQNPDNSHTILERAVLSDLVYAWREISSPETLAAWIMSVTCEDEDFLNILLRLRHEGIRSDTGYYLGLSLRNIAEFFGNESDIKERLYRIEEAGKYPKLLRKVQEALVMNRY